MKDKLVLLIEPDAFQCQLIDMLLAVNHYELKCCHTGQEALLFLQDRTPDLILSEANLSDIKGADLCNRIKGIQRLHKVPFILTASAEQFDLVKDLAHAVGADLVLCKPLGDKHLKEHIATLIKQNETLKSIASASNDVTVVEQSNKDITVAPSETVKEEHVAETSLSATTQKEQGPETVKPALTSKPLTSEKITQNEVAETPAAQRQAKEVTLEQGKPAVSEATKPKQAELKGVSFETVNIETHKHVAHSNELLTTDNQASNTDVTTPKSSAADESKPLSFVEFEPTIPLSKPEVSPIKPVKSVKLTSPKDPIPAEPSLPAEILPVSASPHPAKLTKSVKLPTPPKLEQPIKQIKPTKQPTKPDLVTPSVEPAKDRGEIALLKHQLDQLIEENQQLKEAIREFKDGSAVINSESYLNAIEELEALRRLTEFQARQIKEFYTQNEWIKKTNLPKEEGFAKGSKTNSKTVWNRIVGGI